MQIAFSFSKRRALYFLLHVHQHREQTSVCFRDEKVCATMIYLTYNRETEWSKPATYVRVSSCNGAINTRMVGLKIKYRKRRVVSRSLRRRSLLSHKITRSSFF